MIKAIWTNDGAHVLILGLSRENTKRLLAGQPIRVDVAELRKTAGLTGSVEQVLLVAGEDEAAIERDLRATFPMQFADLDRRKKRGLN